MRLFKLARTRNLTVTAEQFAKRDLPAGSGDGEQPDTFPDRVTLVMRIAPEMAYRAYDFYSEDEIIKNGDGSLTVTQREEPEDNGMYGFILSFGEYAEVLEPKHIRDVIHKKALAISKNYS